jgi:hypothetical protein
MSTAGPELEKGSTLMAADACAIEDQEALRAAELLQRLVRARRFYLDDFIDGDGPYWICVGLYIDDHRGRETTLDRIVHFADESIEAGRVFLDGLLERGIVQPFAGSGGTTAYRLAPAFSVQFGRYLAQQMALVRRQIGD